MTLALALSCLSVVVVSLLGGLLPLVSTLTHTRLQLYLSFAAGTMLGAAFFHMMPEAVASGSSATLRWAAGGLTALFLLERFFAFHHHEAPASAGPHDHEHHHDHAPHHDHSPPTGTPRARVEAPTLNWTAAAVGLAVHSLIGGVALASAVVTDYATRGGFGAASWGVLLATVVHKPADSLTVVSLMLRARSPQWLAHVVNFGFSLMIPIGVALFLVGMLLLDAPYSASLTASALAFSAGTFLCIALSDLLPELHFHSHDRTKLSVAFLLGLGLMLVSSFGEGDHAHAMEEAHEHEAHELGPPDERD
ncbi:ZIP family metal transporter [Tautonia plasticadhaerens]|uniref:Zinc transporter ZupT n=1 Tax=Tautonia plasticadhaerens TaxID=2527974 RepID=A0A518GVV0_9BACT|nr:ZIP family metal transporter [Tautonia plasticadhaerens]QDV32716.1 zinc transporter ZupT [Tautonia plasticadhaerens]